NFHNNFSAKTIFYRSEKTCGYKGVEDKCYECEKEKKEWFFEGHGWRFGAKVTVTDIEGDVVQIFLDNGRMFL
ncbi:MAG: hypothetical protein JKX84_10120, partial [Flavobacteriales bacterium]|nr:hypothetical protein [Flavobacteriales bacterium]